MRLLLIAACVLGLAAFVFLGTRIWQYFRLFPQPSAEIVELTSEKRAHLERLRAETKFERHDYPPLGYTGAETAPDQVLATAAVNAVIDAVLAQSDGPIRANAISEQIGKAMGKVNM